MTKYALYNGRIYIIYDTCMVSLGVDYNTNLDKWVKGFYLYNETTNKKFNYYVYRGVKVLNTIEYMKLRKGKK